MTETNDLPIQPPTDLAGVAIHLSYLRRDMQNLSGKIDGISQTFVTMLDFKEHQKADEDHEERIRVLEKALWKYVGVSSIATGLLSVIGTALVQHYIH